MKWHKIKPDLVSGRGWAETEPEFGRFPSHAEKLLTKQVWEMRRNTSGMYVDFITDSPNVTIRWEVEDERIGEPNFNTCAFSGVDLYILVGKKWRYAVALTGSGQVNEVPALIALTRKSRTIRLYFPYRNCLKSMEVGVDEDRSFEWVQPEKTPPIVYYGSSIIHGAYASRAGNGITAVLGREFHRPVVNLGFSGAAKMEEGMAEVLTELDPCCYLLDPMPNMNTAEIVEERLEIFLRKLCSARKNTPVIMLTEPDRRNSWLYRTKTMEHQKKRDTAARIVKPLQKEFPQLYFIDLKKAMGNDYEGTIDGVHPDQLGVSRFTTFLIRELKKLKISPFTTV